MDTVDGEVGETGSKPERGEEEPETKIEKLKQKRIINEALDTERRAEKLSFDSPLTYFGDVCLCLPVSGSLKSGSVMALSCRLSAMARSNRLLPRPESLHGHKNRQCFCTTHNIKDKQAFSFFKTNFALVKCPCVYLGLVRL